MHICRACGQEVPDGAFLARILSPKEHQTLVLCAKGYSNTEIAKLVNSHMKSVTTYKERIRTKLGIKDSVGWMDLIRRVWKEEEAGVKSEPILPVNRPRYQVRDYRNPTARSSPSPEPR